MEEHPVKAGLVRLAREWPWMGGSLQEKGAGGTPALPGGCPTRVGGQCRRFVGRYGHQRRLWPCSDCVNLEAYALCQFPVGLCFIGDLVHCTDFSDPSRGGGITAREERPHPGARASRPHKAWHDRGYLPHFDEAGTVQFLTFRLVDAVPAAMVTAWKTELKLSGGETADDPAVRAFAAESSLSPMRDTAPAG